MCFHRHSSFVVQQTPCAPQKFHVGCVEFGVANKIPRTRDRGHSEGNDDWLPRPHAHNLALTDMINRVTVWDLSLYTLLLKFRVNIGKAKVQRQISPNNRISTYFAQLPSFILPSDWNHSDWSWELMSFWFECREPVPLEADPRSEQQSIHSSAWMGQVLASICPSLFTVESPSLSLLFFFTFFFVWLVGGSKLSGLEVDNRKLLEIGLWLPRSHDH